MRTTRLFIAVSVTACNTPSAPTPVVVDATVASASAPDARSGARARPPPSKAGWFTIPTPGPVRAVVLDGGRCLAAGTFDRWLVTPFKTPHRPHPTICDGDAQPLPLIRAPDSFSPVRRIGGGVLYSATLRDIATSESPDGALTIVNTPFGGGNVPEVAGGRILLIGTNDKKLHSHDGATWKSVALDGADVLSVVGTRDGHAFALTAANHLYESSDGADTFNERPTTGFAKLMGVRLERQSTNATSGQIVLRGTASAAGPGFEAGDQISSTLIDSVPIDLHHDVELDFPLPVGVTDRAGVDLVKKRAVAQSLTGARECDAFDMVGDVAVASCRDGLTRLFVFTEDGGATVKEIGRTAPGGAVRDLKVSEGQVLVAPGCSGHGACGDTTPYVLERGDGEGAWGKKALDMPKGVRLEMAIDARQGPGFYLVTSREVTSADKSNTEPVLEVFRTGPERVARRALSGSEAPSMFGTPIESVRAIDVDDDGSLALVVSLDRGLRGYLRLSARLEPAVAQPCESPLLPMTGAIALRGRQVAAATPDGRFAISTDGCNTMTNYEAIERTWEPGERSVECGPEGCDFTSTFREEERLWRWGSRPAHELMGPAF